MVRAAPRARTIEVSERMLSSRNEAFKVSDINSRFRIGLYFCEKGRKGRKGLKQFQWSLDVFILRAKAGVISLVFFFIDSFPPSMVKPSYTVGPNDDFTLMKLRRLHL
jgi:hypothetical protein